MLVSCTTQNFVSYGTAKSKRAVLKGGQWRLLTEKGILFLIKGPYSSRVLYRVHEELGSSNSCSGLV